MNHHILKFLVLLCSMTWAAADFHSKPDEPWVLVAKSSVIVTGTLNVPVEQIQKCLASNKHDYVTLSVKRDQVIKGNVPSGFKVKWYTRPDDSSPDSERLIKLNGQKVMLFLTLVDDLIQEGGTGDSELFFAGRTPQALADPGNDHLKKIEDEVFRQKMVLETLVQVMPSVEPALLQRVRKLIDATARKDSQKDAFRQLEALGWNGVPAMILLMDDRRDLADPHIELKNGEGHFEGIRQYGPRKVVDAMDAILNQITHESFGDICSGGTERGRKQTVDGWAMYLYYWKMGVASEVQGKSNRKPADAIEASDDFRASAIAADKLMVYEGLPHQQMQRDLMLRESKRKDVTEIAGYSFYTPAVPAKELEKLKKLLGDPKNIALYRGEKLCGGFHPDYAVVWETGGKTYQILVCYRCHEVCFVEGKRKLRYELANGPWACLSDHASKCPAN